MTLLERDWILETLDSLTARAASDRGSMVFISGEAGAGKSSVVRAFLDRHTSDVVALSGSCDSMPTPGQLWPLRDLAERASPALREPVLSGADREALFRGALAELSARAGVTVMAIEDIQWADDATLDLLRFLGRRVAGTRALVIATYRDDNSAQLQRLRLLLGDLATIPAVRRIALPPLSREAVAQLAQTRACDPGELYARTGGNAFFVTEMLAAGTRIPDTLSDAISARYANLSSDASNMLGLAAVLGQSMELRTLQSIGGERQDALVDTIESGALQFEGGTIRFRHALVRDAVLASIPPLQRSQLYGRVFDAFEASSAAVDPATMAHFAEEAGRFDAVPGYAKAAAQRAAELRSYREAALQYRRAIRYSTDWPLPERSELLGQLASATYYCGSGETDIDALRKLVDTCRAAGDQPRLVDHLIDLAWVLNDEGMLPESQRSAEEAVRIANELGDPALRAAALCALADIYYQAGRSDDALEMDAVALELALQTGRIRTAVHIGITMGSALLGTDRPTGVKLLEQCAETAQHQHFDGEAAHAMSILGFHYTDTYELDRADSILTELIGFTAEHDLDCWWRWANIGASRNALSRGDWARAATLAKRATELQTGCFLNRMHGYLTLARIRARRGDPEVEQAIQAAVDSCGGASFPSIDCSIALVKAEAAYLADDGPRAIREAMAGLTLAIEHRMPWYAGQLAHYVLGSEGALPESYEPVGPYRAERDSDWRSAHAAWQELGAPYEAASAQAMLADEESLRQALAVFEQLGAQPMAAIATRRLRALGVTPVPRGPRLSTRAHPFGLTSREAEVLEQMGEGLTNAEIATRFFLSERTVEHHVSAVLAKLGVKSRREAVRLARELEPSAGGPHPLLVG